jgi:KipI family sensor histidine kinase inhibitor
VDDLQITRYGSNAILVRFADRVDAGALARCRGLMRALAENPVEDLEDFTPAYGSLLLEFRMRAAVDKALGRMREVFSKACPLPPEDAVLHEIPVRYDGEDLDWVADSAGLTAGDVIELHCKPVYDAYMIGFSPGFPYLGPLDERLHCPRRDSPRLRVPAGSVAIGGAHTGIYSIASPGGWRLIGNTPAQLFSVEKAAGEGSPGAFLLGQGDRVKFLPV